MNRDSRTERQGTPSQSRISRSLPGFKSLRTDKRGAYQSVRRRSRNGIIFIGPSVEGADQEYVKVLSGEVDRKKPSFA
ncbi:hypothetical protein J2T17_001457 [Paenibacillus mucilaginosus]|uniref:hypothetical protein n=1 Tax=Paenibacillus mucilaginosus TaxID=61624 RepID=UPI003D23232D